MENDTLELIELESMLDETPKCESVSHDLGRVECSEDVGYRVLACGGEKNICTRLGRHLAEVTQDPTSWCMRCGHALFVCLRIYPI